MKIARDPASKQAMRYIKMFDEALKRRGVHVRVGIEEEFMAKAAEKYDGRSLATIIDTAFKNPNPEVKRTLKGSEWGRGGQCPINRFEREEQPDQYEFSTTPSRALRAAHRVAVLKKFIAESEDDPNLPSWNLELHRPFRNVKYSARIPILYDYINNGLHVNVSLNSEVPMENTAGYLSLMSDKAQLIRPYATLELLKEHIAAVSSTDLALVSRGENSMSRLLNQFPRMEIKSGILQKPENDSTDDNYIEYRIPDASSNPYFAVLMVMAASYSMLKDLPVHKAGTPSITAPKLREFCRPRINDFEPNEMTPYKTLPFTHEEAVERFKSSSIVMRLMHDVAEETGVKNDRIERDMREFMSQVMSQMDTEEATLTR